MNTDEDFNIKFVQIIKQHRCLYDKKVPEYRNKDFQEKSWVDIARETKESVSHCKERWRNLRACLSRYIKQQSSLDPQHKPYYLIEHMSFLLPFLKPPRQSSISISSTINNNNINSNSDRNSFSNYDLKHLPIKLQFPNHDESTIDGFNDNDQSIREDQEDIRKNHHQHHHHSQSPIASETDTASLNYVPPPEVQIEMRTDDTNPGINSMVYMPGSETYINGRNNDRGDDGNCNGDNGINDRKRIKLEENCNGILPQRTPTCSFSENTDMDFFRSILPDIDGMNSQQKRKFKIGVLELIDDIFTKYPGGHRNVNGGY